MKYTFRLKYCNNNVHIFIYLLLDVVSRTENFILPGLDRETRPSRTFQNCFHVPITITCAYIIFCTHHYIRWKFPNTLYNIKQAYFLEIQYGYIVNFTITVEESKKAKMNAQDLISKKKFLTRGFFKRERKYDRSYNLIASTMYK